MPSQVFLILLQIKDTMKGISGFKNENVEFEVCTVEKQHMNDFPMRTSNGKNIFLN